MTEQVEVSEKFPENQNTNYVSGIVLHGLSKGTDVSCGFAVGYAFGRVLVFFGCRDRLLVLHRGQIGAFR